MASNQWKCPSCASLVAKTDEQKFQQQGFLSGKWDPSVLADVSTKCPSCGRAVPLDQLARGAWDAAAPAGPATFPCGHDFVSGRTNCPECYSSDGFGTCALGGALFGGVGTLMVILAVQDKLGFKLEDHVNPLYVVAVGGVVGLVLAIVISVQRAKKDF